MIAAKLALGTLGTLTLAGAYVFHEGVIRVAVDEHKGGQNESHVHFFVPAAAVPLALHVVPEDRIRQAEERLRPLLPAIIIASRELGRLPDADLVEVRDAREHVQIRVRGGKLLIDVESPRETVHLSVPLRTVNEVARELESRGPAS